VASRPRGDGDDHPGARSSLHPLGRFRPGPFEGWGFIWKPALLGFAALWAILAGCSFTNAPFKLNYAHTWFFGVPSVTAHNLGPTNDTTLLFSIVLVYGGLVLLMRVWLRLAEITRLHPGSPVKAWWWTLALWSIPMIVAPPLFSRDVFSYAAQGEMTSLHISPYVSGPFDIGSGPFVTPVDPLWGHTPAPYGPFFLFSMAPSLVRPTTTNSPPWSVCDCSKLSQWRFSPSPCRCWLAPSRGIPVRPLSSAR
jgi:hypothetical protein